MLTNRLKLISKNSLYWLLPVVLLNVFLAVGVQEHLMELPSLAQTEQLAEVREEYTDVYIAPPATSVVKIVGTAWSHLAQLNIPEVKRLTPNKHSVFFATNNLLCFYGKAAPEALDGWWVSLHA